MFKKKSFLILLIIVVLILVAIFVFNDKEEPSQVEENFTMDESEVIAQSWVENNAPTYKFDGENLTLKDSHKVGLKEVSSDTPQGSESSCQDCYEFSFEFTSRHAGYGERDGQMLAQVITPHVINVTVESGQVTRAVTDEKFNEITGEMLEVEDVGKSEVREYLDENISDLAPEEETLGGQFYVNKMLELGRNEALVQYEDGHMAYVAKVDYSKDDQGNVSIDNFENVDLSVENVAKVDFSQTGNLKNEDGDITLIYEEPGKPALTKILNMNDDIVAYTEADGSLIETDYLDISWTQGTRAVVHGVEGEDDSVDTLFITFFK